MFLRDALEPLELSLINRTADSDRSELTALLADDFLQFTHGGKVITRAQFVDALQTHEFVQRIVSDCAARELSSDIAQVTYHVHTYATATHPTLETMCSSIWRKTADNWQIVFQQMALVGQGLEGGQAERNHADR